MPMPKIQKIMRLLRISHTPSCVVGLLSVDGIHICLSIERPWANNTPMVSCIPVGKYILKLDQFNKADPPYANYAVKDVHNRTAIEIHAANKASQLSGCIAPGKSIVVMDGEVAITRSRHSHQRLMVAMNYVNTGLLVVEDADVNL